MQEEEGEMVTPGEVLGKATELKAGKGAYIGSYRDTDLQYVFSSLTGLRRTVSPSPDSPDQRPTVEVTGHKAHGAVPEPGSVVIARVTKVMAKTASADIMCVGPKSVRDKFTGIIRQQDVRSTEIDKVDMHLSFRPGDIIRALVLSLGDARAYYLSTAKNELGVVSAESAAGQGYQLSNEINLLELRSQVLMASDVLNRGDLSINKDLLNHEFLSASGATGFFHLKFKPDIQQIADFQTIIMMQALAFYAVPFEKETGLNKKVNLAQFASFFSPRELGSFITPLYGSESSDSPQSIDPSPQSLLQELSDCFDLPPDYFQQLPRDLRLDLNDAAFDLSNGPVLDECGKELGEILLNLSRAWELGETSTSQALACKLPMLERSLTNNAKSAFGKRLISSGRRFQSMGQYGQGELQKIAQTMITTGKLLSASSMPLETDEESKKETRVFKFGELQVEITPQKANIGAVIGLVFGILSWELAQGIQSIPESSLEYANDNALLLAKSLRVALLALCFSSAFLSACTTVALFLLARQLKSKED
ncbi:hypothetical protein OIU79_023710 [Salix purpurea]|uniref:S1 motif domain-containing protein n=1 Tax=Salix purpurea TaxID=77065 RepID=A0A9Q0W9D8_SALPP|nr:hypothetical protein OIU79_023710 [Salix purpurea]